MQLLDVGLSYIAQLYDCLVYNSKWSAVFFVHTRALKLCTLYIMYFTDRLTRGLMQRKTWCIWPYAGADYNLTLHVYPRVDSNTFTMGNPMPESTLTLCKSRLYPLVRDFGFEIREWLTLLTVETEVNGDSQRTNERGPSLHGLVVPVRDFHPVLAAMVSPVQSIFFLIVHCFNLWVPIAQKPGQAVVQGRLSLNVRLRSLI